jgi:hypothetical protein
MFGRPFFSRRGAPDELVTADKNQLLGWLPCLDHWHLRHSSRLIRAHVSLYFSTRAGQLTKGEVPNETSRISVLASSLERVGLTMAADESEVFLLDRL